MNRKDVALDLDAVQQKLAEATGRTYWRSLEELAQTEAFQEMLHREFPENADEWGGDALSRRRFLTLMGASLALAGLSGCSRGPQEKILPYIVQPEGIVPTRPQFYASAYCLGTQVTGILVESHMGRPTKIEGNPEHPGSLGATDAFAQADILTMYDPDREQNVTHLGRPRVWEEAIAALRAAVARSGGARVRILTETVVSPTLGAQLRALLELPEFQGARVVVHEPTATTEEAAALKEAFPGEKEGVEAVYNLDPSLEPGQNPFVILALDADFLGGGGAGLRYARQFGASRAINAGEADDKDHGAETLRNRMSRLYAVESMITPTGAIADHRLALKPTEIDGFVRALAAAVGVEGVPGADNEVGKKHADFIKALAADLTKLWSDKDKDFKNARNPGTTVVIPGPYTSATVQKLAHAINDKLGNIGKTVSFVDPVHKLPLKPEQTQTLAELIKDMNGGKVGVVLVLGGNPVYSVPPAMGFTEAFEKVEVRAHLGLFNDETSALCQWHLPATHALEQWSDARTFDGTATIIQPLIAPLYAGRSAHEVIAALAYDDTKPSHLQPTSGHEIVRAYWKQWHADNKGALKDTRAKDDFELFWKQSLFAGVVGQQPADENGQRGAAATAFKLKTPAFDKAVVGKLPALAVGDGSTYEVTFRPDPALFDGRYANNGWLQEFPKPITKITWDNVAYVGLKTAEKLGLAPTRFGRRGGEHGEAYVDVLTLQVDGRQITVPAWIVPGHAEGCITLTLGYGRERAGRVAMLDYPGDNKFPVGVNVGPLRKDASQWLALGVAATKGNGRHLVACTQGHHNMEGRDIIRTATFDKKFDEKHKHDHWYFDIHASGHHGHHGHAEEGEKKDDRVPPQGVGEAYGEKKPLGLLPGEEQKPGYHRWGMVINLGACTGCSACVVACQAENNIPVVGKEQVIRGREMHWIRVDRYYYVDQAGENKAEKEAQEKGETVEVGVMHQPMPCQQCEKAPCEQVCPVAATTHSADGLNDMVYNRCVGTRYCSNNCPYKVRRFNFLDYQAYANDTLRMVRNPEVTVRTRGVMEKCTYCVQRIRAAEIEARKDGRKIADGEVVTACQAVCPTGAIVFGDLGLPPQKKDEVPDSLVGKLRNSALNYALLDEDLQTHPRTTYLAAVRNPNPLLVPGHGEKKD